MKDEKFLILMEKYFDNELTKEEEIQFNVLLNSSEFNKQEFSEQKKVKEVLINMKMKNPSVEVWDGYWENIYNKFERGIGWLAVFLGVLILLGYGSIEFVSHLYTDDSIPTLVKIGTISLVFGLLVVLFSVFRERLFTYKTDKYKETQR